MHINCISSQRFFRFFKTHHFPSLKESSGRTCGQVKGAGPFVFLLGRSGLAAGVGKDGGVLEEIFEPIDQLRLAVYIYH